MATQSSSVNDDIGASCVCMLPSMEILVDLFAAIRSARDSPITAWLVCVLCSGGAAFGVNSAASKPDS